MIKMKCSGALFSLQTLKKCLVFLYFLSAQSVLHAQEADLKPQQETVGQETQKRDETKKIFHHSTAAIAPGFHAGMLGMYLAHSPMVFLPLYVSTIIIADLFEFYGHQVWDPRQRTADCYNRLDVFFPAKGTLEDYSEGLYFKEGEQEYSENLTNALFHDDEDKATEAKFDFLFQVLKLGDLVERNRKLGLDAPEVLDAGCGNGAWMEYLRTKGVKAVGLTLSERQSSNIQAKGFKKDEQVFVWDYTKPNPLFVNRFDAITTLGSTEHLCNILGILYSREETERKCERIFTDMLTLLGTYTKKEGSVFSSLLTMNHAHTLKFIDYVNTIALERLFAGAYPDPETVKNAVSAAGFEIAMERDFTAHYHWASVLKLRPGKSWRINWHEDRQGKFLKILSDFVTDPHFFHFWFAYFHDSWLRHLGGAQDTPLTQDQVDDSPSRLKYLHLVKARKN